MYSAVCWYLFLYIFCEWPILYIMIYIWHIYDLYYVGWVGPDGLLIWLRSCSPLACCRGPVCLSSSLYLYVCMFVCMAHIYVIYLDIYVLCIYYVVFLYILLWYTILLYIYIYIVMNEWMNDVAYRDNGQMNEVFPFIIMCYVMCFVFYRTAVNLSIL